MTTFSMERLFFLSTFIASLTVITKLISGSFPKRQQHSHKGTAWHLAREIIQAGEEQSHTFSYFPARDDGRQELRAEFGCLSRTPQICPCWEAQVWILSFSPRGGGNNPNTKELNITWEKTWKLFMELEASVIDLLFFNPELGGRGKSDEFFGRAGAAAGTRWRNGPGCGCGSSGMRFHSFHGIPTERRHPARCLATKRSETIVVPTTHLKKT